MPSIHFQKLAESAPLFDQRDQASMAEITASVRGYSDARHYSFFRGVFSHTEVRSVLLLGVYFGRDTAFMCSAARRCGRSLSITAVDKFTNDACDDWPSGQQNQSWEEAGFGPAPSVEAASANIERFKAGSTVQVIQQRDDLFLASCQQQFDLIYIDTSHDYETVRRQLRQARRLAAEGGLLAGDDYSDEGTWGVRRALREAAPAHAVFAGWIWITTPDQLLPDPV
jgi:predicted O-methyltransferase YrrM